ncbi:HET-domain-containing protein [Macroventuria anomochaeta]|uniref:HET-domain-containing protein n=1 Tax=Macroventuria anomochaeta TaxID=301207 RepID=A0ACB6S747_9PLEO|nr:HET-domain-containing protein [Macroventuria anomochaeta]KAF2628957.1 HET-domain-containing protein [Macroventuria anomochaeta]
MAIGGYLHSFRHPVIAMDLKLLYATSSVNAGFSQGFLPTRFLRINSSQEPSTYSLVLREEYPPDTQYTALSYCWGTGFAMNSLQLLNSAIASLRQEGPVDSLPEAFRDARRVITYISVHYLWIDSLCIFLDSVEDWKRSIDHGGCMSQFAPNRLRSF